MVSEPDFVGNCKWMLTRLTLKKGEGTLEEFNPKIGSRRITRRPNMAQQEEGKTLTPTSEIFDNEEAFRKMFLDMKMMIEELYIEWQRKRERKDRKKEQAESSSKDDKGKGVGGGRDPPEPPSPSSSSSSSSSSSTSSKKKQPVQSNSPLLKFDVKFDLPIYNGELDADKLDNWIKQIEVYCRIQKFTDDTSKIQLATLRLGGPALIWWESRTQEDLIRHGKIISSWYQFIAALKK